MSDDSKADRTDRLEYFKKRRKDIKKQQEDIKNLNGELFFLCREQMVEIGAQRLLANGWTTYSLGKNDLIDALQNEAKKQHDMHLNTLQEGSSQQRNGNVSNISNATTVNSSSRPATSTNSLVKDYRHCDANDQSIDLILKTDGFVPRLLQRYFELTAGPIKDNVVNRSSATCSHAADHATCLLDNVFPLYCVVLVHLLPGAGPLIYPVQRLGRSLSMDRADMLATSLAPGANELSPAVLQELQERFGFILQKSPAELLAEMDGPGRRETGDVTIIASDMLYSMPSGANFAYSVPKRQHFERPFTDSTLPSGKKLRTNENESSSHGREAQMAITSECATPVVSSNSSGGVTTSKATSSSHPDVTPSLSTPPSSTVIAAPSTARTLYAYTIYQPKADAALPPCYIPHNESSNKIRVDPAALHKLLVQGSGTSGGRRRSALSTEWKAYNLK
mmetsp:Transcript_21858/g.40762  ORF Transcript_21858/g.40762 Transcript_21858/m.40762 type:complete len:449 (+) Transcript_21858:29-1375(+)